MGKYELVSTSLIWESKNKTTLILPIVLALQDNSFVQNQEELCVQFFPGSLEMLDSDVSQCCHPILEI